MAAPSAVTEDSNSAETVSCSKQVCFVACNLWVSVHFVASATKCWFSQDQQPAVVVNLGAVERQESDDSLPCGQRLQSVRDEVRNRHDANFRTKCNHACIPCLMSLLLLLQDRDEAVREEVEGEARAGDEEVGDGRLDSGCDSSDSEVSLRRYTLLNWLQFVP